jgi:hypothetical protein
MDIAAWLRGLGLERYEADFRDNEIDCRVDGGVAVPIPHRPGRADFPHPVLHERDLLAAA